jgi:hypothetical protein
MTKYALINKNTNEVLTVMIGNFPIEFGSDFMTIQLEPNSRVSEGWIYNNGEWQEPV